MAFFTRPASSHGRPRTAGERKRLSLAQQTQVVPVAGQEVVPAGGKEKDDTPHWQKLPKKYEQMKKKAVELKRRRQREERKAHGTKGWLY